MQLKNKIRIRKNSRLLLFNDVLKAAITFSGNLLSSWCHIGNGKLAHGMLLKIHQNTADYQLQFSRWYVLRDWTRETESVTKYGLEEYLRENTQNIFWRTQLTISRKDSKKIHTFQLKISSDKNYINQFPVTNKKYIEIN